MVSLWILLPSVLAALGIGVVSGYLWVGQLLGKRSAEARLQAQTILDEAEEQKKQILLASKEEALRMRADAEQDLRESRRELGRQERRVQNRDEQLDRRQEALVRREQALSTREGEAEALKAELEELKGAGQKRLEAIALLTQAEAREIVVRRGEEQAQHELARRYFEIDRQMKEEADQRARKVVSVSIQRLASEVVSETTTSVVPLPNDEMKGRLIGREGRNIRAIEAATGVDLIIDDTPEAVTISCFDPVRREVARLALSRLIQDGRIQPARIEETVARAQEEVDETMRLEGEKATYDAGVQGINPELVKLLGRLKYRYSYGENVLMHSVEVSLLAGMLAAEVGANVQVAKMGGLLHDIGKALSHEVEGPHAEIGADVAARYGIRVEVQQAIMEHHDTEKGSVEAFLVAAADAISAARPGARRESLEHYVKRLENLEAVANSFPGVSKSFAIQAGREIRVMVKPETVDDIAAASLARDVVKKIEETLVYPGQIKVTVVRETRAVEYAR